MDKNIKSTPSDLIPIGIRRVKEPVILRKKSSPNITKRASTAWNSIEWTKVYKTIRNLRYRIFKATKRGDFKTVRNLQRLLIHSYEIKLLAVRQICQINEGKKKAGLDKLLIKSSQKRGKLVDLLREVCLTDWQRTPVKPVYVPKDLTQWKGFGNQTIIDRCLQYIVKNALEPEWEAKFEATSYGFRPGRSCHDALHRIYNNCAHHRAKKVWVVNGTVTGCFDQFEHQYLMKAIGSFPAKLLIEAWLKNGYLDQNLFDHTILGTSHGGVISPLLANIALHDIHQPLDISLSKDGETIGDRSIVRYADAFVVFCKTEEDAKCCKTILNKWLSERGLNGLKAKMRILDIDRGFDFLGMNVRRYPVNRADGEIKNKLLIKPDQKSISKCREKLKQIWIKGQGKPVLLTITGLNSLIRSWANHFKPYLSKEVFASLDNSMFAYAVRFTRRTHPMKSWGWRKNRYFGKFHPEREDKWVFGNKETGHYLLKFSWVDIQRHTMIKADSSPDNPELSKYWEKRNAKKSKEEIK
uniref:Putative reverse transcriptase and intron maturase n=1 Tax=Pleurastrosarcina brevispinosa TaxID=163096 RepID=A0A097KNA0_9CHLO|nr:putative reverse transcriptase and intron maturase [Chlorosarcina brevispinosa]